MIAPQNSLECNPGFLETMYIFSFLLNFDGDKFGYFFPFGAWSVLLLRHSGLRCSSASYLRASKRRKMACEMWEINPCHHICAIRDTCNSQMQWNVIWREWLTLQLKCSPSITYLLVKLTAFISSLKYDLCKLLMYLFGCKSCRGSFVKHKPVPEKQCHHRWSIL